MSKAIRGFQFLWILELDPNVLKKFVDSFFFLNLVKFKKSSKFRVFFRNTKKCFICWTFFEDCQENVLQRTEVRTDFCALIGAIAENVEFHVFFDNDCAIAVSVLDVIQMSKITMFT